MAGGSFYSCGLAAVVFLLPLQTVAQEFQYSTDQGAIVQFTRDKNLSLSGRVCAPGTSSFCDTIDFTGKNIKNKYILSFDELGTAENVTIEYDRKRGPLGPEFEGYSVWETKSPDAPDFLKTMKAPITKTDDPSSVILQEWGGKKSALVSFDEHLAVTGYANEVTARLGYPTVPETSIPIVLPRIEAASWEAIAQRVDKTGISITNFGADAALVYASKQVVAAAVENRNELEGYALNSMSGADAVVIPDNSIFDIRIRSESLFDAYVKNNSDIQSIASDLIYFLDRIVPSGKCRWVDPEDQRFSISCLAHSDDYRLPDKRMFVACVFSFMIGDQVDGFRRVTVNQWTRGGGRKKNLGPPPPTDFSHLPELNADVAAVSNAMRQSLKTLITLKYPRSG